LPSLPSLMSSSGLARGGLPVASKPGSASGPLLVDCVSDEIWFAVPVGACAMPSPRSPPVPWVAARVAHNFTDRCPHPTLPRKRGREPLPLQSPASGGGNLCPCNRPQAGEGDVCIIGAPSVRETSSP